MFVFGHRCGCGRPPLTRIVTPPFFKRTGLSNLNTLQINTFGLRNYLTVTKSGEELRNKPFEVFQFFKNGSFQRQSLTLRQITRILPKGFRLRDLRGSSSRQISQILVREDHFWVIVEHLMTVVTAENLILFRADSKNVSEFAENLSETLKINTRLSELSILQETVSSDPFEIVVLEEILSAVGRQFEQRMNLLLPVVKGILNTISTKSNVNDTEHGVVRVIPMSNTLTNFQTSITELRSAIEDVLQSDDDLAHMCLTNQDRTTRIEVEMLLENFSKKTEELSNEIQEILTNIQTTKKAIEMTMSNTRNNLMRLNLHISLMSLTLASASVIGSIFGMNLTNGFEHHPYMFYVVVSMMPVIGSIIYSIYAWHHFGQKRHFALRTRLTLSSHFFDKISSTNFIQRLANENTKEEFQTVLKQAIGNDLTQHEADQIFENFQEVKEDWVHPEALFREDKGVEEDNFLVDEDEERGSLK